MKKPSFIKHFNWRASLMRVLINAAALTVIALILPNIRFVEVTVWNILFVSIALGVLNAVIKPILQFLTLSFIFTTYGLVVVLINAVILWLLAFLFPDRFQVNSILAALIGGALIGVFGSFFESLFGLSMPIVPDEQVELRKQSGDQTQVVTKMILRTDQEEVGLADPAEPLPANHQDDVSLVEKEPGLDPAQQREVKEGKKAMEEDAMPVDEDLENADTLDKAAEQATETGDDIPTDTSVPLGEESPGLNPAQEREVERGKKDMEGDTMPVDDDLENADTLNQAAEQAAEASNDDPNETLVQKQENESWQ